MSEICWDEPGRRGLIEPLTPAPCSFLVPDAQRREPLPGTIAGVIRVDDKTFKVVFNRGGHGDHTEGTELNFIINSVISV